MTLQKEQGDKGEALAASFLQKKGYTILHRNWRHKHAEVDLIAQDGNSLVIVEVKARSNMSFGQPETFVDGAKQNKLIQAANAYIEEHNWEGECRFDIVAVDLSGEKPVIEHFVDAFYPRQMNDL